MKKIIIFVIIDSGEDLILLLREFSFIYSDSDRPNLIAFCANKSKIDKDELLGLPVFFDAHFRILKKSFHQMSFLCLLRKSIGIF